MDESTQEEMKIASIYGILLTILPKIPCVLSIIGSSTILSNVLRSKSRRKHTYQRIMAAMAFVDLNSSLGWFLTNFLMTHPNKLNIPSIGNSVSCEVQGFVLQFSIASPLYNASLSIYYYLVLRKSFQLEKITRIEAILHGVPIFWGTVTAVLIVSLHVIDDAAWNCWIQPRSAKNPKLARTLQFAFFYGPLWISMGINVLSMYLVRKFLRKTEKDVARWKKPNDGRDSRELSRAIARQNMLYALSFFICWTFPTLVRILQFFDVDDIWWADVVSGSLLPFQGFFNTLIYFQPRYQRLRLQDTEKSMLHIVQNLISTSFLSSKGKMSIEEENPMENDSNEVHSYYFQSKINEKETMYRDNLYSRPRDSTEVKGSYHDRDAFHDNGIDDLSLPVVTYNMRVRGEHTNNKSTNSTNALGQIEVILMKLKSCVHLFPLTSCIDNKKSSEEDGENIEVLDSSCNFQTNENDKNNDNMNNELTHFQNSSPNLQTNQNEQKSKAAIFLPDEHFHENGGMQEETTNKPNLQLTISTNGIHGIGSLKIILAKLRLHKTME